MVYIGGKILDFVRSSYTLDNKWYVFLDRLLLILHILPFWYGKNV